MRDLAGAIPVATTLKASPSAGWSRDSKAPKAFPKPAFPITCAHSRGQERTRSCISTTVATQEGALLCTVSGSDPPVTKLLTHA